jgi:hypothetical protein
MTGEIITKMSGRNIVFRDEVGLVHQCKGYEAGNRTRLFWTLCQRGAPAEEVRAQTHGQAVTCPDCLQVTARPARQILSAHHRRPRRVVGGLPFRPDPE